MTGTDGLDRLLRRHAGRFHVQKHHPGLLPDITAPFGPLKTKIVVRRDGPTSNARRNLLHHAAALSAVFEGRSELEFLHALCIAHLRRRTKDTPRALQLFRRMWQEESDFLLERLSARWLVSVLQTFYDHGSNAEERIAGAAGFFYGNLMKVYETERAALGPGRRLKPDDYPRSLKSLPGMGGFRPGDDVLANINVLALDAAMNGGMAGPALMRLIQIAQSGTTIFQRTDALRHHSAFRNRRSFTLSFGGTETMGEADGKGAGKGNGRADGAPSPHPPGAAADPSP